jgi:hypothetical protein
MNNKAQARITFRQASLEKIKKYIDNVRLEDQNAFYWLGRYSAYGEGLFDCDMLPLSENFPDLIFKVSVKREGERAYIRTFQNGREVVEKETVA